MKNNFKIIEEYMLLCMDETDTAHGKNHIYRVLNNAMSLKNSYIIDEDVLIAACLLHDIARKKEAEHSTIDHAIEGSIMAYDFLKSIGWSDNKSN